jgi:hypothetical protein
MVNEETRIKPNDTLVQLRSALRKYMLIGMNGDATPGRDSWRDDFWGWGPGRDGKNMLGRLWMEVRAELKTPNASFTSSKTGEEVEIWGWEVAGSLLDGVHHDGYPA